MKTTFLRLTPVLLFVLLILAACQMPQAAGVAGQAATQAQSSLPVSEPTATPLPRPTKTSLPTSTATLDPQQAQAEQAQAAVKDYFSALEQQDFEKAASLLSTFSLNVFTMTRGDAVSLLSQMRAAGTAWSGLDIIETSPVDQYTQLVHVKYTLSGKSAGTPEAKAGETTETKEARDEQWVLRIEGSEWHINWNNLIDFRTLDVDAQTLNGMTVKPVQANRFPDRIQLVMLVQNRTTAPVVFGQVNEILGTFYFNGQAIEAEKIQMVFNPMRSVPDFKLEVKGSFDTYPDSIEIRKWKTYNVKPWYTFQLN